MGRKKRVVKIAKVATVRCPGCGKSSRLDIPEDRLLSTFDCPKCKEKIMTPPAYCCIICAFSKKKCTLSQIMEAKMKGLEIKQEKSGKLKPEETAGALGKEKPKVNIFVDKNIAS